MSPTQTKMKIELYEITTDENGYLLDHAIITHIASDRTKSIGMWELPETASVGESKHDEPAIFLGDDLYYPARFGKSLVLQHGMDRHAQDRWVWISRAK